LFWNWLDGATFNRGIRYLVDITPSLNQITALHNTEKTR
jgi:hypothetical protein